MVALGDAFTFRVRGSHLWVVVSRPIGTLGEFVMVNLTTLTENTPDASCVLEPRDYPSFIRHPTCVRYIDARRWSALGENGFDQLLAAGGIHRMARFSDAVLLRIQEGALNSDFLEGAFEPLIRNSLIVIPPTWERWPPPVPDRP